MKQKTFSYRTIDQAIAEMPDMARFIQENAHSDALITLYASELAAADMSRLLAEFDKAVPEAKRAGISEYPYNGVSPDGQGFAGVKANVMLSDSARFCALQIPCAPGGERGAAERFEKVLGEVSDVKGIALYPSNPALDVTGFLRRASKRLRGVPFFGAMSSLSSDPFGHQTLEGSYGIGSEVLASGFTAVAFCGDELDVLMDYVLGWRPVGREMDSVLSASTGIGESCIATLDGRPAVEVYDKYLGVRWNEDFIANVCEFPLLLQRNGVDVCMVPSAVGAEGELHVSGCVMPGDKIRFSYGTREGVLEATRAGRDRMRAFGAQAALLSLCGNRAVFLGDDAHVEWDLYREVCPDLAFCHGNFEIAWRFGEGDGAERGGVLNSALVAVGFREGHGNAAVEGADAGAGWAEDDSEPVGLHAEGPIPLSYRLSRFFDVMTGELVHLPRNLEQEVERKTRENEGLALHVVITLATAIDAKDSYTNGHSSRVARYAREIARRAGYSEKRQREIFIMGILHDVGKIGVPDAIITKPGRLTDGEFAAMKEHPAIGARILSAIEEMPGLATGAHWHHERYDGNGYPDGLAGDDIPEEARIIAVADAYDAMTSNRSYRDAMPQDKVRDQVVRGRGTQFDPRFADIMLEMIDEDVHFEMRERKHG